MLRTIPWVERRRETTRWSIHNPHGTRPGDIVAEVQKRKGTLGGRSASAIPRLSTPRTCHRARWSGIPGRYLSCITPLALGRKLLKIHRDRGTTRSSRPIHCGPALFSVRTEKDQSACPGTLIIVSVGSEDVSSLDLIADAVRKRECILFLGAGVHAPPPEASPYNWPLSIVRILAPI